MKGILKLAIAAPPGISQQQWHGMSLADQTAAKHQAYLQKIQSMQPGRQWNSDGTAKNPAPAPVQYNGSYYPSEQVAQEHNYGIPQTPEQINQLRNNASNEYQRAKQYDLSKRTENDIFGYKPEDYSSPGLAGLAAGANNLYRQAVPWDSRLTPKENVEQGNATAQGLSALSIIPAGRAFGAIKQNAINGGFRLTNHARPTGHLWQPKQISTPKHVDTSNISMFHDPMETLQYGAYRAGQQPSQLLQATRQTNTAKQPFDLTQPYHPIIQNKPKPTFPTKEELFSQAQALEKKSPQSINVSGRGSTIDSRTPFVPLGPFTQ